MTHKVAGSTMQHSNQGTSGCRLVLLRVLQDIVLSLFTSHFVLNSVRYRYHGRAYWFYSVYRLLDRAIVRLATC